MRVGGYARLSLDDEGTGLAIQRQQEDIQALITRQGWTLAEMYTDSNVSAYKNVIRPQFERLLEDLEAGKIDGVAIYNLDRLARQPRDLERLLDLYDRRPLVFATCEADIDLSTSEGRFMSRLAINFANKSSADTARRVARAQLQRAQQGKVAGGGYRAYGYQRDNVTIVPWEAEVIRSAAERVLLGESLISICKDFDHRGLPTPGKSVKWNRTVLRSILLNPRVAGLRSYKGAVLLGADGPVKAMWEAVLQRDTWEQLTMLLTDTSRRANGGRVDRKYLLSGFLRCPCGAKMTGAFSKGAPEYRCPNDRGCGKTRRKAEPIDAHVTEVVLQYLERQELDTRHRSDIDPGSGDIEIAGAEQSLSALIDEWTAGRISDAIFFTAQARKEAHLNNLRGQRAIEKRRQTMKAPVGAGVREAWEAANLSQRRAILQEVVAAVKCFPKPVTAPKRFDPQYYSVVWRTD